MSDLNEAANTFTSMLHAIDTRDWASVRRAFTDTVDIDYRSLFGAPPATVDADTHVAGWRAFGDAFDATQHITGPIVVTPAADGATAHTHIRAYHRMNGAPGGDTWMVAGHYDVRLSHNAGTWTIAAITLTVFYQEGNLTLPDRARARADARTSP
jgi:hypothetical protein